jgi:ribosome-associated toxin RatA of RatAB toxin-antitoxin module
MKAVLPLRFALGANALFSFVSGLLMLVRPSLVGGWLGIDAPRLLQIIGFGLLIFAAELVYQAARPRMLTWRALLASAADFLWVIGSVVLLVFWSQLFSPGGGALVAAVAGIVFLFGVAQLWATGQAHKTGADGAYRHCVIVETNAPADKMWPIVANLGEIKHYMPSLKDSVILDGRSPVVGAVRACVDHAGKAWREECVAFQPGQSFVVRFLTEAPDFPFPVQRMRGGWQVTPSAEGSQVMVWWELTPKNRLLAPVILPMLAFQADRDFPQVVRRMAAAVSQPGDERQAAANGSPLARLAPIFC